MMHNGLFRHLLPGDEDTEGLERVGLRVTNAESEQGFIGLASRRSGVGGKGAFQLNRRIPVGAKLRFGSSERILAPIGIRPLNWKAPFPPTPGRRLARPMKPCSISAFVIRRPTRSKPFVFSSPGSR